MRIAVGACIEQIPPPQERADVLQQIQSVLLVIKSLNSGGTNVCSNMAYRGILKSLRQNLSPHCHLLEIPNQ